MGKLVQICSLVDENMVIFKDKNEILNVKENKLKNYVKQDQSDIVKNPNFQKRHISGIEAQKIGLLNTTGERKTVCREEKLPILTCKRCSYKTKRPNHLEKHMKKHGILQENSVVKCDQCQFRCLRTCDLAKHKRKKHSSPSTKKS